MEINFIKHTLESPITLYTNYIITGIQNPPYDIYNKDNQDNKNNQDNLDKIFNIYIILINLIKDIKVKYGYDIYSTYLHKGDKNSKTLWNTINNNPSYCKYTYFKNLDDNYITDSYLLKFNISKSDVSFFIISPHNGKKLDYLSRRTQLFLLAMALYQYNNNIKPECFNIDKTEENCSNIYLLYNAITNKCKNIDITNNKYNYYSKYLKYKTKYLELQKLKNNNFF